MLTSGTGELASNPEYRLIFLVNALILMAVSALTPFLTIKLIFLSLAMFAKITSPLLTNNWA